MFWKKKSPDSGQAAVPPTSPGAAKPDVVLTSEQKADLAAELTALPGGEPDMLSASLGWIKSGERERFPAWIRLFGRNEVYVVSVGEGAEARMFTFGPEGRADFFALFTRRELAQKCLEMSPKLKAVIPINGLEALLTAQQRQKGVWVNPLNSLCNVQVPAEGVGRLIEIIRQSPAQETNPAATSTEPPPLPQSEALRPVRLAIGPSPWTWRDRSHVVHGVRYRFREHEAGDKTTNFIKVVNEAGETLLLLGMYCYARMLDDGDCLLWWKSKSDGVLTVEFRRFYFSALRPLAGIDSAGEKKLSESGGVLGLPACDQLTISCRFEAGRHGVVAPPPSFARFEETLVLAENRQPSGNASAPCCTLLVFNWLAREVEVLPQDWFNHGSYDFDYQWITRVARTADGKIVGDGVRLGRFELDSTGRQIAKWIQNDPFYMLN